MQEKDIILKYYESDNVHFCDFVNGVLSGGKQLFCPERLISMPTEVLKIMEVPEEKHADEEEAGEFLHGDEEGREQKNYNIRGVHRFRDLTKKYQTDQGYVIIAIQNQSTVDYGMPLRVMLEDALEYDAQIRSKQRARLHKDEKLMAVITIVFYHGSRPWNGAVNLADMVCVPEELGELKRYGQAYSMVLVTPENVDTACFHGEWREIFEILKRQGSEMEMQSYLEENRERYEQLNEDTNHLLFALTGRLHQYRKFKRKGEKATMCKAFRDHYKSGVRAGRHIGRQEGLQEGLRAGRKEEGHRFQMLITAMVQAGETSLLPKLGEDRIFLNAMYDKYEL